MNATFPTSIPDIPNIVSGAANDWRRSKYAAIVFRVLVVGGFVFIVSLCLGRFGLKLPKLCETRRGIHHFMCSAVDHIADEDPW